MTGPEFEQVLAELCRQWTDVELAGLAWSGISAHGRGEIEVRAMEEPEAAGTLVLRLIFDHATRRVALTNIFMPRAVRHRGIGKGLMASIRAAAHANGYTMLALDLVPGFYDRLVRRGARVVVEDDVVEITRNTDLSHRHG